jgi:hypothetical protein
MMTSEHVRHINPIINKIVSDAVSFFRNPGPVSGDSERAIEFAISLCRGGLPDLEISSAEMADIWSRFTGLTTHPPRITEEELANSTHTDSSIDGSWFEQIQEFPKWEKIKDNWINGHSSSRMPPIAIDNIDTYSSHIISSSNDPKGNPYLWKGLVVGNVQSGKTATYTGLIGKAIDVGYRIIIVMSGRMNSLRYQTEARITYQITGANDEKSIRVDDSIHPLTNLHIDGDFGGDESPMTSTSIVSRMMTNPESCLIGVMKKNTAPINKLAEWADEISQIYPDFRNLPILIIDDEMDEAGTDIGGEREDDANEESETEHEIAGLPSPTNQAITNLLREDRFSKRMYLGFTATPYAVILHQRRQPGSPEFQEYGPDIFPDNYLMVLDDPDSYCGGDVFLGRNEVVVREMSRNANGGLEFGNELLHLPAFEGVGGVFNEVDDSDLSPLVPDDSSLIPTEKEEAKDYEHAQMTDSLESAIDDFIMSGAARAQRGDGEKPCTMMVNVSHRAAVHFDVRSCILRHLESLSSMYETGMNSSHLDRLKERWKHSFAPLINAFNGIVDGSPEDLVLSGGGKSTEEQSRTLATSHGELGARPERTTSFDDISPFIAPFIHEIAKSQNNRVLNGWSTDVVDFDREPGLRAIIHGGYNLGRGLTFKGMVSTYLLRGHGDMSGLMQMQRWCGYRREEGGERLLDLMRLYMQDNTRLLLQRMLTIEKKNRYTLGVYIRENKTPAEFRTVMEQDPDYPLMSAAKRGALKEIGGILAGSTRTQRTFSFTKEEDEDLTHNQERISAFLVGISGCRFHGHSGGGYVYRDVPTKLIQVLLTDWRCVETSGFRVFELESWIKRLGDWNESQQTNPMKTDDELTHWTVYLPSRVNPSSAGVYVPGFNPDQPIDLAGEKIVPYSYTLDRGATDRLKVTSSPDWTKIDETLFFSGGSRPSSHGLMLISPIIHPLNRKSDDENLDDHNLSISSGNPDQHKPGDWPNLISLGFWFPSTTAINTTLVEHGGE